MIGIIIRIGLAGYALNGLQTTLIAPTLEEFYSPNHTTSNDRDTCNYTLDFPTSLTPVADPYRQQWMAVQKHLYNHTCRSSPQDQAELEVIKKLCSITSVARHEMYHAGYLPREQVEELVRMDTAEDLTTDLNNALTWCKGQETKLSYYATNTWRLMALGFVICAGIMYLGESWQLLPLIIPFIISCALFAAFPSQESLFEEGTACVDAKLLNTLVAHVRNVRLLEQA